MLRCAMSGARIGRISKGAFKMWWWLILGIAARERIIYIRIRIGDSRRETGLDKDEKDGDVHYFNYEWPKEPYTIQDRAAFQFMDVDFDGTKELLASEGDFSREGNAQRIYRLKGGRMVPADDLPFSCVRALTTKFDVEKKTVIERTDSIFEYKRLGHKLKLVRVYPINRK